MWNEITRAGSFRSSMRAQTLYDRCATLDTAWVVYASNGAPASMGSRNPAARCADAC
jgi:hypothetical protein